jgi:hypothetical protein
MALSADKKSTHAVEYRIKDMLARPFIICLNSGGNEMSLWRDAHTLGLIADALEAQKGRHGFFQEKGHCFPVLIEDVYTGFGNAALKLTPKNPEGSLRSDETFSFFGPLDRFYLSSAMLSLESSKLVTDDAEVALLNALHLSDARRGEISEQINLLEMRELGLRSGGMRIDKASTNSAPECTVSDKTDVNARRTNYVYLALASDQICLDAFIPPYGRMILRTDQCVQVLFLLWELAAEKLPELTAELIAIERQHARDAGKNRFILSDNMEELFGEDQGARWAFGHREADLCASSLMKDTDLIRIIKFICQRVGWHVDANMWPEKSLNAVANSTYRMSTHWRE